MQFNEKELEKQLLEAIENSNIQDIKRILGYQTFSYRFFKQHFVVEACKIGNIDVVRTLLNHKRFIKERFLEEGLLFACKFNHINLVKILVSEYELKIDPSESKALHIAAINGHFELVKFIVDNEDKNINNNSLRFSYNENILRQLVIEKEFEILRFLLETKRGAWFINSGLLFSAICHGNDLDFFKFLIKNGVDSSSNFGEALISAVNFKYFVFAKFLLEEEKLDPSMHGNKLIGIAVANNDFEIAELLLKNNKVTVNEALIDVALNQENLNYNLLKLLFKYDNVKEYIKNNSKSYDFLQKLALEEKVLHF